MSGVTLALDAPATSADDYDHANPDPATSSVPWRIYNIGNGESVGLMHFIKVLEAKLGKKAEINGPSGIDHDPSKAVRHRRQYERKADEA